jgi:hypothetical protein
MALNTELNTSGFSPKASNLTPSAGGWNPRCVLAAQIRSRPTEVAGPPERPTFA